jgi:hypothetical protein
MLTKTQIEARDGKLTASRVACLMTGDESEILSLWREMIGDPAFVPEDLSGVWPVQLGSHTESLNLDWFERKNGVLLKRRGEVVMHKNGWAACTLDGWFEQRSCPVECKHVGGREPLETIIARYMPQMHWQMIVTGAKECALSVIMGANEPVVEYVPFDKDYAAELWSRAGRFMECVRSLTAPVSVAPVAAPVKAEKSYDFSTNNHWCSEAVTFIGNRTAAKDFAAAEKALKSLVPSDAIRVTGGGIECRRDRANRLSIKELVQ